MKLKNISDAIKTSGRTILANDQLVLAGLALAIGIISGGAVIGFREGISFFQNAFFGTADERLFLHLATLKWWQIIWPPVVGGLVVGILVRIGLPENRPQGVADVIEANALKGGRMSLSDGLRAAIINAVSIGSGASVGREGPAVHLGAALAANIAKRLNLSRSISRTLLGCGVAAAVAGSFNAPIAGALFANEVVIGHYALKAFAPVVIASVAGTAISRSYFGDFPAFTVPPHAITTYFEFPAFIVLGIVAGLVASALVRAIAKSQDLSAGLALPRWLHPMVGGLGVGVMAIWLPQVIGVGYGATEQALMGNFTLVLLVGILLGKILATAISLGFGFGGGIFSPSMVIGAMLGGAYGIIVTTIFPQIGTDTSAYSLIGMGAVAAATLGAPISTALIIFEMTGDYQLTLGVMLAVVVSTGVFRHMHGRTFFTAQLERRGLDLKGGFESGLLRAGRVRNVMKTDPETVLPGVTLSGLRHRLQCSLTGELFVVGEDGRLIGTITLADLSESAFDADLDHLINASDVARLNPPMLKIGDDLEKALKLINDSGESLIAVVADDESKKLEGVVDERHVIAAYNRALLDSRHEEHDV
ncbi:MAG: chloride channel protein [Rhodospirillaceae bacterium]|nr:chloride channel protein [Rhodospirillaceae bacterium]